MILVQFWFSFLKKFGNYILLGLLLTSAVLSIFSKYQDSESLNGLSKQNEKLLTEQSELKSLIKEIVIIQGNRPALLKKHLKEKALMASEEFSKESSEFVEELIKTLPKARKEAKQLSKTYKPKEILLQLRWEPVINLVLGQFDERANLLKDRGIDLILKKQKKPSIVNKEPTHPREWLRQVIFTNSHNIEVDISQAIFESGKLTRSIRLVFREHDINGPIIGTIKLMEDGYSVEARNKNRYKNVISYSSNEAPINDKEFKKAIISLINNAFSIAVLEEKIEK